MNKKFSVLLLICLITLLLVGCGTKLNTPPSETNPPATEPEVEQVEDPEPVEEPDPVEEPEPVEVSDPLEPLLISESDARTAGGAYLLRGEKLYTLNHVNGAKGRWYVLYRPYSIDGSDALMSLEELCVPVYTVGDKILMYSSSGDLPKLNLHEMNFHGYTIPVVEESANYKIFEPGGKSTPLRKDKINNFSVTDSNGQAIEDISSLTYGEVYTVSWYEGTQYCEVNLVANCGNYIMLDDYNYLTIEGTLTKEGYMEFDISNVAPGLYAVPTSGGGLIIIE
ncbi:MAG: hypothetical protein IJS33_00040 [Firmicutes bacterium]|nr:hypothetical protein [Bacillota bacterium]